MSSSSIVDSGGFTQELTKASLPSENTRGSECLDSCFGSNNGNVFHYLLAALPLGVKFEPSDVELLDHLAAKCEAQDSKPHPLIDQFIPTLESDEGVCYTHPENLPGSKKDGSTFHCFYRIVNAYASGKRKRRRIQNQESTTSSHVRWHKTGRTVTIMKSGVPIGFKKIMVLHGPDSEKYPWVMHQYHLGTDQDEKEGEFVVSKISYHPHKESVQSKNSLVISESDGGIVVIPRTPIGSTPDPPRAGLSASLECTTNDYFMPSLIEDADNDINEACYSSHPSLESEIKCGTKFGEESQPTNMSYTDIHSYNVDSYDIKPNTASLTQMGSTLNPSYDNIFGDLDKIELDTQPHFQLHDFHFCYEDSLYEWTRRF